MRKAALAAGLLVSLPALADGCAGLGDTMFCAYEPASAVGTRVPDDGEREGGNSPPLVPADIQILGKGDATPLLLRKPLCVTLGDMSCG